MTYLDYIKTFDAWQMAYFLSNLRVDIKGNTKTKYITINGKEFNCNFPQDIKEWLEEKYEPNYQ